VSRNFPKIEFNMLLTVLKSCKQGSSTLEAVVNDRQLEGVTEVSNLHENFENYSTISNRLQTVLFLSR
jgi:hypothetical protein